MPNNSNIMHGFYNWRRSLRDSHALLRRYVVGGASLLMLCCSAAFADDRAVCNNVNFPADVLITVCSRILQEGNLQGHDLSAVYHSRGVGYLRNGRYDQAISDFNEAIRLYPEYASAYRDRGLAWERKSDLDRAMADDDEAIRLDPKDSVAFNNRGYLWQRKGDLDRALTDYDQAIGLNSNYALALVNRGLAYERKGDLDRAITDHTAAIRSDPKYVLAYNNRGVYYDRKGDWDRAIADFNEVIRLNPKYAHAYRNRGLAWRHKGDLDRALADYDEAIRLDPNDALAFSFRGYVRQRKGAIDSALADYNESIRINPADPSPHYNRGIIFRTNGDFDNALTAYTEAIRLDPAYPAAFTSRGLAYEGKHDIAHARADFQAALDLPLKYDNGKWARDTAQARLAVLSAVADPSEARTPSAVPPLVPALQTKDRLALVIGNSHYRNAPTLTNPLDDAHAMTKALRDIGFEVIEAADVDRSAMERALLAFLQRAPSATLRLLFYAGHGIQIDGSNYLVPADAMVASKRAANFELIDVDHILKGLDDEAHENIIILDACRDNPFENRIAPSRGIRGGGGLAAYQSVSSGTLIAFATAPGNTAADGAGSHSPFTSALLKHIGTPGIEVNQMLTRVRIDVAAATERKQIPWVNSSLLGEVYLAAVPLPKPQVFSQPSPLASPPQPPSPEGGAKRTLLGRYGEWGTYTSSPGGKKVCFAIAKPTSSETNPPTRSRDPSYMLISSRPADRVSNEVSILIGYQFKSNSEAVAVVGSNSFALYTQRDSAWVKNVSEEARMIDALRAGQSVVVKGVSTNGTQSTDIFSLKGLSQALNRTAEECR